MARMLVEIYTDGSVSGNGKQDAIGGWSAILQAFAEDMSAECARCEYQGVLGDFDDTESDGDIWGTCPKCNKHSMIYMNDRMLMTAEKEYYGKLVYETDSCPVTNNRAEMYGILKALEAIYKPCDVVVNSDSELCIKTLKQEYSAKANSDLWDRIGERCKELRTMGCTINFQWVRGHAGNPLNERCDKLASKAKKGLI